jgi:transcriptional regulator of nitric oxide reductase
MAPFGSQNKFFAVNRPWSLQECFMQMVYNSDNFVVVQFDLPHREIEELGPEQMLRGGYEIVDKFARKEIFIEGAMAESFKDGVTAMMETSPSEEEMDDYIERYTSLMQHPVILH